MKRHKLGELSVVAVCIVVGFLLAVQLKSVEYNSAVADATSASRLETLQEIYNETIEQYDTLEAQYTQSQEELSLYRENAAQENGYTEALVAEVERLEILAGLVEVEGSGVTVVMQDSTATNVTGEEADYLIHDSDILSVINELRSAGAEAISLNGERVLSTTEIRCTGAVVTVNGRRYAAPYVIMAIGDSETLYSALTMRSGVVDVLSQWKIDVKVSMNEKLLIPAYNGVVTFNYATPTTTQTSGEGEGD